MPPATTTLDEPALIASCACMIAFMPDPHTLLMVVQPVEAGRPAPSDACRAGAWPRPAGSTQPMITSSTWSAATPACSSAPVMAAAPSAGVGTPVNWPRKEPMAVRLAPTMTTSLMGDSGRHGPAHNGRNQRIMLRRAAVRQIASVPSRKGKFQQVETAPTFMAVNRPETERREQCRHPGPHEGPGLALSMRHRLRIGLDLAGPALAGKLDGAGDQRACDAESAPARWYVEAVQGPGRRLPGTNQRLAAIQARKVGAWRHRTPTCRLVADEGEHAVCAAAFDQSAECLAVWRSLGGLPGLAAHRHAPPHAPATAARPVLAEQRLDARPVVRLE